MLMGLNLAKRASRSGATFRSDIDEVWPFEDVCVASTAIRKNSSIDHRAGRFNFLERGGTTLSMRLSMDSDCIGFFWWHRSGSRNFAGDCLQSGFNETKPLVPTSNSHGRVYF